MKRPEASKPESAQNPGSSSSAPMVNLVSAHVAAEEPLNATPGSAQTPESGSSAPIVDLVAAHVAAEEPLNATPGSAQTPESGSSAPIVDLAEEPLHMAAFNGNWVEAQRLLQIDAGIICVLKNGTTPLHIAVSLKHKVFAQRLIDRMEPQQLATEDGKGLTAFSYAAALGLIDLCRQMTRRKRDLLKDSSALHAALLAGTRDAAEFLLEATNADDLSADQWFNLLRTAIVTKVRGTSEIAVKILENFKSACTSKQAMKALNLLAEQGISKADPNTFGKMEIIWTSVLGKPSLITGLQRKLREIIQKVGRKHAGLFKYGAIIGIRRHREWKSLAQSLLEMINQLGRRAALNLLREQHTLHRAAKNRTMYMVLLLVNAFPELLWDVDGNNCSVFHHLIRIREPQVFDFIQRLGVHCSQILLTCSDTGDSLLHSAAYLGPRNRTIPALQMQGELAWFTHVNHMLPTWITERRNGAGKKALELFREQHQELYKENRNWIKATADTCLVVCTIILTIVYPVAILFCGVGGDSESSEADKKNIVIPKRKKNLINLMDVVFSAIVFALYTANLCVISFWSIATSGYDDGDEDRYLRLLLYKLRVGFVSLLASLFGGVAAFLVAYCTRKDKVWPLTVFVIFGAVIVVLALFGKFIEIFRKMDIPKPVPRVVCLDELGNYRDFPI